MSKAQFVEFAVPPRIDVARLTESLSGLLPHREQRRFTLTYYDTFDWRLYRAGMTLTAETGAAGARLVCRRLTEGKTLCAVDSTAPAARFVREISDRRLRELLAPELEMRALLPQVVIACEGTVYRSDDKDLSVRLVRCESAHRDGVPARQLGHWLITEACGEGLPGMAAVRRLLAEDFALDDADAHLLQHGLTAAGKRPEDPTPSPTLALDPLQRSDEATRAILLQLLRAMEINEAGLMERVDSEFLHDFRVAVRRTRSALGQIKEVLAPRTMARFTPAFAWLGQITGPARDLDVYLLGFEALQAHVPPALRPALAPLRELLEVKAERAYRDLIRQLRSRRYRHLLQSWRKVLESPPAKRPRAVNARVPIAELADRRILKVFRRALKQGKAIRDDTPDAQLHELRKTCKKLRYLLEFFQSLYPADKIRALIKHLKGFQNHLGELQDLSAQIQTIYDLGQEMRTMNSVPAETLLAMGALLGHLDERRHSLRESFEKNFREFSSAENHAHYRRLFSRHAS